MNETAQRLLGDDRPIGESADDALPSTLLRPATEGSTTVEFTGGGETRHYRHRSIPIGPDGTYGRVIVLSDVTSQERMQRDLKRQNERLEEFASVVSHDLRNPLAVAQGNLQLVREERDSDQLAAIERAHTRMATLVEDLLAHSRQGRTETVEPTDLRAVARQAWDTVPSEDASLELADDVCSIRADENRLVQLLENLFRNAIEHGGPDVTVRVGMLAGGFYVEDDGQGVPAEDLANLFERGFSTNTSGTGYGLAIVQSIVQAHGWTVAATDGADGGARFVVTGVALVPS